MTVAIKVFVRIGPANVLLGTKACHVIANHAQSVVKTTVAVKMEHARVSKVLLAMHVIN
jgi:hypothetical protein